MRSDSSSEMPGRVLTLIVNDPSLNEGRKLRPSVKKVPSAARKSTAVAESTLRLWLSAQSRALR